MGIRDISVFQDGEEADGSVPPQQLAQVDVETQPYEADSVLAMLQSPWPPRKRPLPASPTTDTSSPTAMTGPGGSPPAAPSPGLTPGRSRRKFRSMKTVSRLRLLGRAAGNKGETNPKHQCPGFCTRVFSLYWL